MSAQAQPDLGFRSSKALSREIEDVYRRDPEAGFVALTRLPPDQMLPIVRVGIRAESKCRESARQQGETMSREMTRFLHESRKKMLVQAALRSVSGGNLRRASVLAGVGLSGRDLNEVAWKAGACLRTVLRRSGVTSVLGMLLVGLASFWTGPFEIAAGFALSLLPIVGALWTFWQPIASFLVLVRRSWKGAGDAPGLLWVAFLMGVRDREGAGVGGSM